MIDPIPEAVGQRISHDNVVLSVRDRSVDQLRAAALALETLDVTVLKPRP